MNGLVYWNAYTHKKKGTKWERLLITTFFVKQNHNRWWVNWSLDHRNINFIQIYCVYGQINRKYEWIFVKITISRISVRWKFKVKLGRYAHITLLFSFKISMFNISVHEWMLDLSVHVKFCRVLMWWINEYTHKLFGVTFISNKMYRLYKTQTKQLIAFAIRWGKWVFMNDSYSNVNIVHCMF